MKKFWLVTLITGIICLLAGLFLSAFLTFAFPEELKEHADEFNVRITDEDIYEFFEIDSVGSNIRTGRRYAVSDAKESYYYAVPAGELISGLDFRFAVGEVQIRTGDTMEVKVEDMYKDAVSSYVEDGVWYITDSLLESGSVHSEYCPEITITIPKDLNPQQVGFYLAAGMVTVDNLAAKDMCLEVDAGSMKVFYLLAQDSLLIKNGVGEVKIYDAKVNNLTVQAGVGAVSVAGKIAGNNVVNGGIGEVKLTLTDRSEVDFDYKVTCGIGDAVIDGETFHSDSQVSKTTRGNEDYFELNCGIGRVEIELAGN